MRASKLTAHTSFVRMVALAGFVLFTLALLPPTASAAKGDKAAPPWSVQVDEVQLGDVELPPDFRMAIYEELIDALVKNKQFDHVYRSGDHTADSAPNLLILKTTMRKYSAGNETQRAVTTVTGATKLNVRSQLFTRDGKLVLEYFIDGNVRFMGSNMHATKVLAKNVAATLKRSTLPEPAAEKAGSTGR